MLQVCIGEGRTSPGRLTTAATGGPAGAKARTPAGLTVVVTSYCCSGLQGGKEVFQNKMGGNNMEVKETEVTTKCKGSAMLKSITRISARKPSLCSRRALTAACPSTDLNPKGRQDLVLI